MSSLREEIMAANNKLDYCIYQAKKAARVLRRRIELRPARRPWLGRRRAEEEGVAVAGRRRTTLPAAPVADLAKTSRQRW